MLVGSEGQESKEGITRTPFLCSTMSRASVGKSEQRGAGVIWTHLHSHAQVPGLGGPKGGAQLGLPPGTPAYLWPLCEAF